VDLKWEEEKIEHLGEKYGSFGTTGGRRAVKSK